MWQLPKTMKRILAYLPIIFALFLLPSPAYSQPSFTCEAFPEQPECQAGGEGGDQGPIGTIKPPDTIPTVDGDPTGFVAGFVRAGISFLITVAFIIGLIWMIFAGYSFIFAGDDPKTIAAAWSRIYWGLLGLVIVVGAFAIIKLVETFFDVKIISDFKLPTRTSVP